MRLCLADFFPAGSREDGPTSVGRYEASAVIVVGSEETDYDVMVIDSGAVGVHALGVTKLVVRSVMEQRTPCRKVGWEPLIDNVARAINVFGIRLQRARNVDQFVGLAVVQRGLGRARSVHPEED